LLLLGLLPLAVLIELILLLANLQPDSSWRRAGLHAGVLWGSYIVFLNEVLSIWKAITFVGLILAWSLLLLAIAVFLVVRIRRGHKIRLPRPDWPEGWSQVFLLISVVIIVGITGMLAWLSPPQTWDSLNYHMPKVAHWAQNQSIHHYVTGVATQNYMSPGMEFVVLHFYVLSGGDHLVTMVSWLFVLGSIIGVSYLASRFGLGKTAQLFSMLFMATLPMGIVQASSTMTDCAVAFWMIAVAAEAVTVLKKEDDLWTIVILGLSAGLAILTKPTGYAFTMPFAILMASALLVRKNFKLFMRSALLAFILVLLLNIGHLYRNQKTYGNPFGPQKRITALITDKISLPIIISNTLRNATLHAGTPSPYVNKGIYLVVVKIHELMGVDVMDPATTHSRRYKVFPPSTHEDLAANPLHALLILIALILSIRRRKRIPKVIFVYGLVVATSFVLVSSLVQWQLYNTRLHQPFFVLAAPWAVFMLYDVLSQRYINILAVVLLAASWPWLVHIPSRPIVYQRGESYVDDVFTASRFELYYANGGHLKIPQGDITALIKESSCTQVGLLLRGNGAEYPIWALLGAPRDAPRIEWLVDDPAFRDGDEPVFQPCAIILQLCAEDQGKYDGLPRVYEHKPTDYCLYLDPEMQVKP
jgi:4-amino-4-deoxy-L-arabinose transferase-like glycosyltransferase